MKQTLDSFRSRLREMNYYERACTLLSWDMYTATPKLGFQGMADAPTFFSTQYFSMSTSDELLSMLEALAVPEEYEQLDEGMKYTVRTMLRDLKKMRRIPKDFYEAYVAEQSASMQAWEEAKHSSDYSLFAPHLEKLIEMTKQKCAYTDPDRDCYEVLLDTYEEGMDSASIDRVFNELRDGLLPLLSKILARPLPESRIYQGTYAVDAQKKVQELLLKLFRCDGLEHRVIVKHPRRFQCCFLVVGEMLQHQ